jgi:hypothetical protein
MSLNPIEGRLAMRVPSAAYCGTAREFGAADDPAAPMCLGIGGLAHFLRGIDVIHARRRYSILYFMWTRPR